jgi:hypothetical protein
MEVAEIAVRFGDTTFDVRDVATGTFRIGTAPDVDLALDGLTSFPLVDWIATERCMLRIPAGVVARQADGTPLSGSLLLRRDDAIELVIDRLAIRVSLVTRVAPLARPRIDLRWSAWVAGALAVHLFALGLVHAFATPEAEGVHVASIMSRSAPTELTCRRCPLRGAQARSEANRRAGGGVVDRRSRAAAGTTGASRSRGRGARRASVLGSLRAEDARRSPAASISTRRCPRSARSIASTSRK